MSRIELPNDYVQNEGSVILSDPAAWTVTNGTKSTDTEYVRNSTTSLKVSPLTNSCVCQGALNASTVIGPESIIMLAVYLKTADGNTVPATGGNPYIDFHLENSGGLYGNSKKFSLAAYHLKWDQWNLLPIHAADTGIWNQMGTGTTGWVNYGTGSFSTAMTRAGVILGNMNDAGITAYIDSIVINPRSRPKILFGFDAISDNLTSNVLPELTSRGIAGYSTFNFSGGAAGSTSIPLAQQWRDAGWEIVNHGYDHLAIGKMTTDAAIVDEVERNWAAMVANGLVVSGQEKIWVGPENSSSPRAVRVLRELGYVAARNYRNLVAKADGAGFDNLLDMGSYSLGNPTSRSRLLNICDAPIRMAGTMWLFLHEVNMTTPATGPTGNVNTTYIDDLLTVVDKLIAMQSHGLVDLMKPTDWYKGLTQPRVLA